MFQVKTWRIPEKETHWAEVTGLTPDQAVAYLDIEALWLGHTPPLTALFWKKV